MRRFSGLLAALLVGSAAGVALAAGPAAAAACPAGQGVTVVVGSSVSCDAGGGSVAASSLKATGHSLTMVDRQPGFVCRVDGAPSSASCVNTPPGDAYWGLFWSDGRSGTWTYASQGVGSLKIPAGGWVAMVFQTSSSKTYPGVNPVSAAPAPAATTPAAKPSAKPKPAATPKKAVTPKATTPAPGRTGGAPAAVPGATPGATPAPTASASPSAKDAAPAPSPSPAAAAEQPSAAPETSDEVQTASSQDDTAGGSGPLGWVAAVLVIALVAGMGAVLWRRKAAGGPS